MPLDIYPAQLHGLGFTVTKSPEFKTAIQPSPNAYENRLPQSRNPIWHFILVYNYLYDRYRSPNNNYPYTPYSDLSTLIGFYLAHGGTAISFLFDDPKDRTAAGVLAGAWRPNHDYLRNQVVIDPKGHAQLATTPGTSGGTQPSIWNNVGGPTTDGTVTWTDQGSFPDGFPNAPIALQILDDEFGSFYSPVQRILGGTLYEDITDLNGALSIWADGVLQVEGTDYDLLGPGLILNEVVYTGLYLKWAVQPNPLVTAKFTFYFRVSFETDSQDFEHFMDELWAIGGDQAQSGSGTLKLITARPPSPTQPGPPLPPPAPSVVSATMELWTAFINTSGAPAQAQAYVQEQGRIFAPRPTPYTLQSDPLVLSAFVIGIMNTTGQVTVGCFIDTPIGTSAGPLPASIEIYDCYIDVVYSDTSVARIRPSTTSMNIQGIDEFGAISDAANAIDSDTSPPSTFATLLRIGYDPLDFYNAFEMHFAF